MLEQDFRSHDELLYAVEDGRVDPLHVDDAKKQHRLFQKASIASDSTDYLDGLRGLAAVMVFQHHIFVWLGSILNDHFHGFGEAGRYYFISLPGIRLVYSGGGAAVSIFFILSGFVLAQNLLRLHQAGEKRQFHSALVSAVVRRPFRLYLPCWIIGLICAFVKHVPCFYDAFNQWGSATEPDLTTELRRYVFDTLAYFQPFRDHDFYAGAYTYGVVMWTIPIELKGSMLMYAIVAVMHWLDLQPAFLIGLLSTSTAVLFMTGWWTMGCFLAGLSLAIARCFKLDVVNQIGNFKSRSARFLKAIILITALYLLSQPALDGHREISLNTFGWNYLTLLIPHTYNDMHFFRFWISLGAILFVWSIFQLTWLRRFFGATPLRYLGKVSFMLYLIHLPLAHMVGDPYLTRTFGFSYAPTPSWWDNRLYIPDLGPRGLSSRWSVQWTILFGLTLALAHLATLVIDEPCTRFSQWVGKQAAKPFGQRTAVEIAKEGEKEDSVPNPTEYSSISSLPQANLRLRVPDFAKSGSPSSTGVRLVNLLADPLPSHRHVGHRLREGSE